LNPVLYSFCAFPGTGHQGYLALKAVADLNDKSSRKRLCLYVSQIFLQFLTPFNLLLFELPLIRKDRDCLKKNSKGQIFGIEEI
jgi:hypothetical protein